MTAVRRTAAAVAALGAVLAAGISLAAAQPSQSLTYPDLAAGMSYPSGIPLTPPRSGQSPDFSRVAGAERISIRVNNTTAFRGGGLDVRTMMRVGCLTQISGPEAGRKAAGMLEAALTPIPESHTWSGAHMAIYFETASGDLLGTVLTQRRVMGAAPLGQFSTGKVGPTDFFLPDPTWFAIDPAFADQLAAWIKAEKGIPADAPRDFMNCLP